MDVKVGQWYREDGGIYKITEIDKDNKLYVCEDNYIIVELHLPLTKEELSHIVNTPQELIQVGDLIGIGDCKFIVMYVENNENIYIYDNRFDYKGVNKEDIKSIYTPNEDKSVYTEQWEQTKI